MQLLRGRGRKPPLHGANRRRANGSDDAGWLWRGDAPMTSIRAWSAADTEIEVEQLSAVAHQPVVVQRDETGGGSLGERSNDRRRQARQMMDVCDIGPEIVHDAGGDVSDDIIPIGFGEGSSL